MFALLGAASPFHLLSGSSGFQASDLVTRARFDPGAFVIVVAAGGWFLRARSRARSGSTVPAAWHLAAFFAGLAVIVVTTMSGLATFAPTNVIVHLVSDTLLLLIAPLLLAFGAPISLAMAGAEPRSRDRIEAAVESRAAQLLTHPVTVWVLLGGSMVLLYFTGLYRATVDHRSVADVVDLGLVLVGLVFCWPAVAIDPVPRPSAAPTRMITVFMALPAFTILGMALLSQNTPIAPHLSVSDLHSGGDVLWAVGSMLGILGAAAVLVDWVGGEEASARQRDLTDDAEAEAQLALWRANRAASAMEDALARAPIVKVRPGPEGE